MNIEDNRNIMLIDYEYAGWNPMAMDLSNYINETILENAYPLGNGINWYLDNIMDDSEIEKMVTRYMQCYYQKYMLQNVKSKYENEKDFIEKQYANLLSQVWDCCLLNNFFWGVWALALLNPDTCTNEAIFNFDFAQMRC